MKFEKFDQQQNDRRDPSTIQADFNRYIQEYNEDFLVFLRRAASGNYNGLVTVGRTLKDLHEMIVFLQSATPMRFEIIPLPFTVRRGKEYYRALGFTGQESENIESFFNYVRKNFNEDFKDWMSAARRCTERQNEHK